MTDTGYTGTLAGDALSEAFAATPSFDAPIPPPEIHQGVITGVLWVDNNNKPGGRFSVGLKSNNSGIEADYAIFPPLPFVENIYASADSYSTEAPVNEETGKVGISESASYARSIHNNQGTATLQVLMNIARAQGHTTTLDKPTTIDEFATVLGDLLSGTEVVFTRSVDQNPNDPAFAGVLRVRRIMEPEVASNPKRMRYYEKNGYKIAWS